MLLQHAVELEDLPAQDAAGVLDEYGREGAARLPVIAGSRRELADTAAGGWKAAIGWLRFVDSASVASKVAATASERSNSRISRGSRGASQVTKASLMR